MCAYKLIDPPPPEPTKCPNSKAVKIVQRCKTFLFFLVSLPVTLSSVLTVMYTSVCVFAFSSVKGLFNTKVSEANRSFLRHFLRRLCLFQKGSVVLCCGIWLLQECRPV